VQCMRWECLSAWPIGEAPPLAVPLTSEQVLTQILEHLLAQGIGRYAPGLAPSDSRHVSVRLGDEGVVGVLPQAESGVQPT
jgi:hypothetical protein